MSTVPCEILAAPIEHIEYAIPPAPNPRIYQWQKWWGRKPHNVVREFIERYCPPGGVVLDPFVGSGVTAIEALQIGRRAIVCDLNPMAEDIIRTTVDPPEISAFKDMAARIRKIAAPRVLDLYEQVCTKCAAKTNLLAVSVDARGPVQPLELRYRCDCSKNLIRQPISRPGYYREYSKRLESEGVWWPDMELAYPNGKPFQKRERYQRYQDLFTPRNLLALAYMWDAIDNGNWNRKEKLLLATLFRSVVHLCSRVSGDRRVRPLSAGWTQHSFWFAQNPVEINAWAAFDRKLDEYVAVIQNWQHLSANRPVKIAATIDEVFQGRGDLFMCTQNCATFLRTINRSGYRADYVFTDPPYNGMIQYGELSTMWNAWREPRELDRYLESISSSELTENRSQGKQTKDYYQHLRVAFNQISEASKPGTFLHVTFSSPKTRHRNLTLRAARLAGLSFENLHFQQSVRTSKKALDQPFGSVFGDFIFRFSKSEQKSLKDEKQKRSLYEIVNERTEYILKHRGEETPISIVIAECERELFCSGFFDDDDSLQGDVVAALKKNPAFDITAQNNITFVSLAQFTETPLSIRVGRTIQKMISELGTVTYIDIWSAVLKEYPSSLTPDSSVITDSLRKYAKPKANGVWEADSAKRSRSCQETR
jgi:16S rRNA G966 N2-methylase RsmD